MKTGPHADIQKWIKQHYARSRHQVAAEVIDRTNFLPDRERHWYQPDVVMRDVQGNIRYIIEVENDPMRKAIVGAMVLADRSMRELDQGVKPKLVFVIYSPSGLRQIDDFRRKVNLVKEYCPALADVHVYREAEFKVLEL